MSYKTIASNEKILKRRTHQLEHDVRFLRLRGKNSSEERARGICFPNEKAKAFIPGCSTPNYRFIKVIDVSWSASTACRCANRASFSISFLLSWHESSEFEHDEHCQLAFLSKPTVSSSICNNLTFN